MISKTLEMKNRYNELVAGGMTGKEAAKAVQEEFQTGPTLHTLQGHGSRAEARPESREEHRECSDPSERREHGEFMQREEKDEPISEDPSEHDDRSYLNEPYSPTLGVSEERMREIAREVCQEMLERMKVRIPIQEANEDLPEKPQTEPGKNEKGAGLGRKQNRNYVKVSVTIDKVLWDKVKEERNRLKVSASRMLDILLWRALGRPVLSYERSEPSLRSDSSEHDE